MEKPISIPQKDEVWPSIISLLVPLIQLLLIFSVNLSTILDFKKVFVYPDILTLINILTLFLTLSLISFFWYWRNNSFLIFSQSSDKKQQTFIPPETKIFNLLKKLIIFSCLLFILFIFTTVLFLTKNFVIKEIWLAFLQFFSYSFVVILTGLIIYIWISEYIRKKQAFQREDFLRNLINSLGTYGLIKSPTIKIWRNQIAQGWTSRIVEVEIEDQNYIVIVSFDGLEIFEVYKKEEYEKLLNLPTIEQLQQQIENLKEELTKKENKQ